MILFTSDLHLGDKNITKHRTKFSTIEEHDEYILDIFRKQKARTIVKVLGDFIFDSPKYDYYIEELKKTHCRIQVVMGNHDSLKLYKEDRFEMQLPLYCYKNFWLSHCPIHKSELRNRKGNIHGHLHQQRVQNDHNAEIDTSYFNVNLDVNDYKFVNFETILNNFN